MNVSDRLWASTSHARQWESPPSTGAGVADFHRSLPGYRPTPLVDVPQLARALGVGKVWVKDESDRFGLPAFKVLGAAWAVNRVLRHRVGRPDPAVGLDELREAATAESLTLVAASDGNHGRAVAHMARLLGMSARIYLPGGVLSGVVEAIVGEGAEVIETGSVYDDAVRQAAEAAARQPADILVQDTSWPGYTEVPGWIVEGYSTMFIEVDSQLDKRAARPDLVSVPTGVGSLLQSALIHYRSRTVAHRPAVLAVEPIVAACVNRSLRAGQPVTVDTTEQTIMAGLRCGTVSPIAWPAIRDGLDAAVIITDEEAMSAMSLLSESGLTAGPCGAASLAGVVAALSEQEWRHQLGVDSDSSLLLISTEGRL